MEVAAVRNLQLRPEDSNKQMTRIGINGFGRMGRLAFRAAWDCTTWTVVHINEIKGGPATAAHLLEFDSVHGRWSKSMKAEDGRTDRRRAFDRSSPRNQSRTRFPGKPARSILCWSVPGNC